MTRKEWVKLYDIKDGDLIKVVKDDPDNIRFKGNYHRKRIGKVYKYIEPNGCEIWFELSDSYAKLYAEDNLLQWDWWPIHCLEVVDKKEPIDPEVEHEYKRKSLLNWRK
jgi:hypothetical protein